MKLTTRPPLNQICFLVEQLQRDEKYKYDLDLKNLYDIFETAPDHHLMSLRRNYFAGNVDITYGLLRGLGVKSGGETKISF